MESLHRLSWLYGSPDLVVQVVVDVIVVHVLLWGSSVTPHCCATHCAVLELKAKWCCDSATQCRGPGVYCAGPKRGPAGMWLTVCVWGGVQGQSGWQWGCTPRCCSLLNMAWFLCQSHACLGNVIAGALCLGELDLPAPETPPRSKYHSHEHTIHMGILPTCSLTHSHSLPHSHSGGCHVASSSIPVKIM